MRFQDFARREFEDLPGAIHALLVDHQISYSDLRGIVVLVGPGSFTGTRVTCLIANTVAFAHGVDLFPLDYFSFLQMQGCDYPHVIQANKREVLLKHSETSDPEFVAIGQLDRVTYSGTGDRSTFLESGATLSCEMDYNSVIRGLDLTSPVSKIAPIYIKDPTITLRAK